MQTAHDYKRYAVLYVDDEEMALKYFQKTFGAEFRVLTAINAAEGLKLIEEMGEEIGVLLTDQRMPGQKGVQLLERARQLRPKMVRMMITAYADFGVSVDAINLGNIFRYISKPLQVEDMRNTLRRAMDFYLLQKERDELLREKLSVLQSMVITDRVISLGVLASGICQSLRNPLDAVNTFLNLVPARLREEEIQLDRLRDPGFWRDFHGQVLEQTRRISEAIGVLDANGGRELEEVEPAALVASCIEAVRAAATAKGVRLENTIQGPLPILRANPARFTRLFEVLLANEIELLGEGKSVTVTASVNRMGETPVSVAFEIRDDGPGLPQEALRPIFDPFCIRPEGTEKFGLDLLGVYFLVHHHGGHIEADNAPGEGTTYRLEFPLLAEADAQASSSRDFVTKVLMNDALWERLLAGD
jgi:two-component system probable response regulator PhcQ